MHQYTLQSVSGAFGGAFAGGSAKTPPRRGLERMGARFTEGQRQDVPETLHAVG
jgi:hypothetical protein